MRLSAWHKVLALLVLGVPLGCATTTDSTALPPISQIGGGKSAPAALATRATVPAKPAAANPQQYEADFKLARILERRKQPQRAKQAYQALLQRNPSDARVYHRLGVIAAREGHLDQAEQYLTQAQKLGLHSADLLADLGYLYYLQHRLDAAEQYLQQALKADPGHKRAAVNLGLVLGTQGKFDKALAMFRRSGDDAAAYANLAYVCTQLGQMDRAIHYYDQALTLNKNLRPAAEALAQLGQRKRLLKQQQAKLARAARRKPAPPAASRPVTAAHSQPSSEKKKLRQTLLVGFSRQQAAAPPSRISHPGYAKTRQKHTRQPQSRPEQPRPVQSRPTQPATPAATQKPSNTPGNLTAELWGTSTSSDVGSGVDLPFDLEP